MLQHLPAIERGEFMPASALPKPDGLAGQAIGPYTLVREIGHGGMGTVWLARRTDGRYEGEVAIKFLRSGLFGHGDAARFEREGSILARLSHPHIARLLDAGVMADGTQPYLVLEYIDGEPIDQYCQRLALPVAGAAAPDAGRAGRGGAGAQPAGPAPRPEAHQHPGDEGRRGQAAGLRHRQAAGRRRRRRRPRSPRAPATPSRRSSPRPSSCRAAT